MFVGRTTIALLASLALAGAACAQNAAGSPARLRGTVGSVSGAIIDLTLRDGSKTSVRLADNTRFTWIAVADPAEIKPGSYVGTATLPQQDGTLVALEVQVFPPAMRGIAEGVHDWDLQPQSSMTNATVGDVVASRGAINGRVMTLTYKDGQRAVLVPDGVPVVTYVPADRAALTPGAHVLANVTRAADGTITVGSVAIGRDGLVPPM